MEIRLRCPVGLLTHCSWFECSSSSGLRTTSSEMSQEYESERFLQLLLNKYFSMVLNAAVLSWVDWVLLFWVRVGRCRRGQAKTFGFQVVESAVGALLQPPLRSQV